MTTEQCLLNVNRNPDLESEGPRSGASRLPRRAAGPLARGRRGGRRHGRPHRRHRPFRFADDDCLCAVEEDPSDPNLAPLQDNLQRLALARDLEGRPFQIVPLPMPGRVLRGRRPRCRRATRTSTSRTASFWCRSSNMRTTPSRSKRSGVSSRTAASCRSRASRSCGAWGPSTASRSSNPKRFATVAPDLTPPPPPQERRRLAELRGLLERVGHREQLRARSRRGR